MLTDNLPSVVRRVLNLELRSGLNNRAVIGGLQRIVPEWLVTLGNRLPAGTARRRAEALAARFERYDSMAATEREKVAREALSLLDNLSTVPAASADEPADPTPPKPRATTKTKRLSPSAAPRAERKRETSTPGPTPAHGVDAPVTYLRGIKGAYASKLRNLNVETVRDLLYLFPRRYSEIRLIKDLVPGETQTVVGSVWRVRKDVRPGGFSITNLIVADNSGTLPVALFRAGRGIYGPEFKVGEPVMLTGPVELEFGMLRMKPSEVETRDVPLDSHGSLVPIYPLTGDLRQAWLRARVADAVRTWAGTIPEHLPGWMRQKWDLPGLSESLKQIHHPSSWSALRLARRRLAFDELLLIQLGMLARREEYQGTSRAPSLRMPPELLARFDAVLPFSLTSAQRRVRDEIARDLASTRPMMRLLQGEVGSGKTVVAAAALLAAVAAGYQAAIMAPTEILAGQHYRTIAAIVERLGPIERRNGDARPVAVRLLTGSINGEARRTIAAEMASGEADIVIGTHALIEEAVEFDRLGVVVVDEQHRFGVAQRRALREKGYNPHMLAMTATPIPRTLALTLYGDLDVSVIDEMPPGRQPVATRSLGPAERSRAYAFLRKRVELGEQAFVICPLVEESDKIEAKAATAEFERLKTDVFPDLRLGLLHGRLRPNEKDQVMEEFRRGDVQVLVCTSVVEVGIDVPNATVMLIEGADRFGLAQLHQFRGRVGRGGKKAYCILLADSPSREATERLKALERSQNGFELAEEDLRMRGPGEFFGTRQSGLPDLRIATLTDVLTMEEAREAAKELFRRDPTLAEPQHALLSQRLAAFWSGGGKLE